jgi:NADPH2:quinone reductase
MKAVQVFEPGGAEQLRLVDVAEPTPAAGQVLVKIAAIGVNYIDTYFRTGLYKSDIPISIGMEAAGVVVATGERVAYCMERGSYAEYAVVPAWRLVKMPDGMAFEAAAAAMLQGMTAHYLTHSTYPLGASDTALVHAAAGGTGLLIVQMAKMRGARVIGTTGTAEKAALAQGAGADETILYTAHRRPRG